MMLALASGVSAAEPANKPERLEWFRDLGLGLFIHWSVDSQLGSVISHSMVGASDDYMDRFIHDLPKTFNPRKFNADDWAALARLAGFRYVVFTTKHHSGFCMFDSETTEFDCMNTPFGRDITAEIVRAFRAQNIAVGFYYSPDDFQFMYNQGFRVNRDENQMPHRYQPLMEYDRSQMRELLTNYGPVDLLFIDGFMKGNQSAGLAPFCWNLQPDMVITRGAIETPEQEIPGKPLDQPWESCFTMGTQWQYKPTNEQYKSGRKIIEMLVETRAKGGNLLLNVGPKPDGELPIEQEERLRELALWMFINGECIYGVRPCAITHEGDVWFTRKKDENVVYAIVMGPAWDYGERKSITLSHVSVNDDTKVDLLGQSGEVLEYQPGAKPETAWSMEDGALRITATRAQRIYNDRKWPNPIVFKITSAEVIP
ncbi:MAG: alpha-L-fucosidase [bacterium]|nr:alpha-L-fucosidase [bacterium]